MRGVEILASRTRKSVGGGQAASVMLDGLFPGALLLPRSYRPEVLHGAVRDMFAPEERASKTQPAAAFFSFILLAIFLPTS